MTCSCGQNSEYAAIIVTSRLSGSVAASGPECVRLAGCAGSENATSLQDYKGTKTASIGSAVLVCLSKTSFERKLLGLNMCRYLITSM